MFASDQELLIEVEEDPRSNTEFTQINQSKIDALKKIKSKKLKKRLSEENLLEQSAAGGTRSNAREQERDHLQHQYGFSVEQQREHKHQVQFIKFNQSAVRSVGRHQSSQNISNLIARSVLRQTPLLISKQASKEQLADVPLAKDTTPAPAQQPRTSSLQHSQLINFTEKAAGVVSERNRKFQKPMTLKNLEQKMLQPDDNDGPEIVFTEEDPAPGLGGLLDHEGGQDLGEHGECLEIPWAGLQADHQLNFNSEMISINEFESDQEQDERRNLGKHDHVPVAKPEQVEDVDEYELRVDYLDNEDLVQERRGTATPLTNEKFDVSSGDEGIDPSPVLQFQSQSMADIQSPFRRQDGGTLDPLARVAEEPSGEAFFIRESVSSPNIMGGKP